MQPQREDVCSVEAVGVWQGPLADVAGLRRDPGPLPPRPGTAAALRQAEDQTVAGLAALLRAGGAAFLDPAWGVVAAPCLAGRAPTSAALERFRRQGPSAVSPLVIPTMSLHAPAGTLSLLLGLHGPNFGAGGGPGHVADGLLTALALLADGLAPGVWLVLSAFDPEPVPEGKGRWSNPAAAHAVALALRPGRTPAALLRLAFRPGPVGEPPPARLADLAVRLTAPAPAPWTCPVSGGVLTLEAVALPHRRAG
jgi:hypothetical protein